MLAKEFYSEITDETKGVVFESSFQVFSMPTFFLFIQDISYDSVHELTRQAEVPRCSEICSQIVFLSNREKKRVSTNEKSVVIEEARLAELV